MEQRIDALGAYEIVEQRKITDLNSDGYILKHKKTGAHVVLLLNDDENKVFYISDASHKQYRSRSYLRAFRSLRFEAFPGKRPFCGAGKRIFKHLFKCHDLPG